MKETEWTSMIPNATECAKLQRPIYSEKVHQFQINAVIRELNEAKANFENITIDTGDYEGLEQYVTVDTGRETMFRDIRDQLESLGYEVSIKEYDETEMAYFYKVSWEHVTI